MCSEVRITWKSEVSVEGCETRVAHHVIHPLLKKPGLNHQHYKNLRPISNLTLLAIEKVVALQLDRNGLCEVFQSA